jgi:hypothetical protein
MAANLVSALIFVPDCGESKIWMGMLEGISHVMGFHKEPIGGGYLWYCRIVRRKL